MSGKIVSGGTSPARHRLSQQPKKRISLFEYYGLDWLLLASGLTTKYLMIHQNRWAFATSILGCLAGLAVALMASQHGIALYNLILIGMSCTGFVHWGRLTRSRVSA